MNAAGTAGVVDHTHYKTFERNVENPSYHEYARNYSRLTSLAPDEFEAVPRLMDDVSGWVFDAYFLQMPYYLPRLYELYRALGGNVQQGELHRSDIDDLDTDILVNCTGYWSRELFNDQQLTALRGHLVYADVPGMITVDEGRIGYSYEASESVPDDLQGSVYGYPRTDRLVLGGSAYRGTPDPEEEWSDDSGLEGETRVVGDVEVPARIIEVNAELCEQAFGIDIHDYDLQADYGYRPFREGGIRIEWDDTFDTPIVHNYGHGGAGVTLSWGSAELAADLVEQRYSLPDTRTMDVSRGDGVLVALERAANE
jgi:D-amino-acid oxidase